MFSVLAVESELVDPRLKSGIFQRLERGITDQPYRINQVFHRPQLGFEMAKGIFAFQEIFVIPHHASLGELFGLPE